MTQGPPDPSETRPSLGEVLASLPPWPREWAQRLGRTASRWGMRTEVHRPSAPEGPWEVRWKWQGRPVLVLRGGKTGVEVEFQLPESEVPRLLGDPRLDDELRTRVNGTPPRAGRRRVRAALDSARRLNSLELVVELAARA